MKDVVPIVTAFTGLIGAAGGLIISYLTLRHVYRKDRHIIKLSLREGMIVNIKPGGQKNDVSENMLVFDVVNTGQKDFQVTQIGLQIGRWKGMVISNPLGSVQLPYTLKPDETCSFWTEYEAMKGRIEKPILYNKTKIKGYVKDYMGNSFFSKKKLIVLKERWHYKLGQFFKKQWRTILTVLIP